MPTTTENVLFGTNAYEGPANGKLKHELPGGWKPMTFDLTLLDVKSTGFQAHVYHNEATREVVIAYAGTQLTDRGDREAITDIRSGRLPRQFWNAYGLYEHVSNYFEDDGIKAKISVTGHSLGGALAQYMAVAVKGCSAETFGSPGVLDSLGILRGEYDPLYPYPVVNHVAAGDMITMHSMHVGTVVTHVIDPSDLLVWAAVMRIRPLLFFSGYSVLSLHGAERYRHALNQREGAFDPVHPNYIKDDGYKIDAGPKKHPVRRW
jgi:Lipase (class 3)